MDQFELKISATHLNIIRFEICGECLRTLTFFRAELVVFTKSGRVIDNVQAVEPRQSAGELHHLEGCHALQLGEVDAVSAGNVMVHEASLLLDSELDQVGDGDPQVFHGDREVGESSQTGLSSWGDIIKGPRRTPRHQVAQGKVLHRELKLNCEVDVDRGSGAAGDEILNLLADYHLPF